MPTFEFECSSGHTHERFYKSSYSAPRSRGCPECGRRAKRLIGKGAPPIFRGEGFHRYTGT